MQQVTVRAPASTSNLGPGFDCLGVALSLYNQVTIKSGTAGGGNRMVREAARKFFAVANCKPFDFSCDIRGNVPIGRGLGSSVTVRLGVLHALNEIAQTNLSRNELFKLCAKLEGHPDNAAPASFGGFTVARGIDVQRFKVSPRLRFILLIPSFEIATIEARRLLPANILRINAARNSANVAAIAAAFATREYKKLGGCFVDYLHQPFRKKLVPFLDRVITAAEDAGALGAFLSGSGSAICALALDDSKKVAAAMLRASRLFHTQAVITRADNRGVRIFKS
ncbi:MAG TPA: homoserine kinase, partial [Chthoniobacterales bacterium]|nr:homoserine kinase [Chthoniobacterales bacterium]